MRHIIILMVAMGLLWSTAALGQPTLEYVYDASASGANNSIASMGVKVYGSGQVETLSRGMWGQSPYNNSAVYGAVGTETTGGLAPASWSADTPPSGPADGTSHGWEAIPTDTGLITVNNSMIKDTGDPLRSKIQIDWKVSDTWSSVTLDTDTVVRRLSEQACVSYGLLGNGNLGIAYMQNGSSNVWYREATWTGSTYAWATGSSEVLLAGANAFRGQAGFVDPVNGRFRYVTPSLLGGGAISAVKSGGTVATQTLASVTGLTSAEYYKNVRLAADNTGHYFMSGHDYSENPGVAGTGELHVADIDFNESGGSTATEYYIAGDASQDKYVTDSVVAYDPNNDLVVVAYLEGEANGDSAFNGESLATSLFVRIAERDAGALVWGSPILITDTAARVVDTSGGHIFPMAMELVNDGSDTYLYFAYGTWDAGITLSFGSTDVHVAKYMLDTGAVPGDTDGDGDVDLDDLFAVRNNFGTTSGATLGDGDTDGDGDVDLEDLFTVRNNFGTGMIVPEPVTLSLLTLGAVAGLRRRRR